MRLIMYKKTDDGPVVMEDRIVDGDVGAAQQRLTAVRQVIITRFNNFFDGAPLHGGREWEELDVEEIFLFFKMVPAAILLEHEEKRHLAVLEHSRRNRIVRWWKEDRKSVV